MSEHTPGEIAQWLRGQWHVELDGSGMVSFDLPALMDSASAWDAKIAALTLAADVAQRANDFLQEDIEALNAAYGERAMELHHLRRLHESDQQYISKLITQKNLWQSAANTNARLADVYAEAIQALTERLRLNDVACEICWTSSWAPCEEGTPNAVRDPKSDKTWMVCQMCSKDEICRNLIKEKQEAYAKGSEDMLRQYLEQEKTRRKLKRKNGQGTVYRRYSDNRWVAAISFHSNGKRIRKTTYHSTQSEARESLKSLRKSGAIQ